MRLAYDYAPKIGSLLSRQTFDADKHIRVPIGWRWCPDGHRESDADKE